VTTAKEVLAVYRSLGYEPMNFFAPLAHVRELDEMPFDEAVKFAELLAHAMKNRTSLPVRPSMYEDLAQGRTTEADYLIRPFISEAESHQIDVPTLRGAYRVIKTIEGLGAPQAGRVVELTTSA
jgi:2-dehydropantoate 2-reductase